MNTHYNQQPQNLYLYEQWNTLESYRSILRKSNSSHSTSDHHRQTSTITESIMNFVQSDESQATIDSKLKLSAFSTKSTNITAKIYTDGSKKDEKVGYAVVLSKNTIKMGQFPQNSIYSL
jgi:hypothetical protein